jgi:hypothetical protein
MTCTRCGCTHDRPCPGGCAWSLPDLCSRCLTPDEARIEAQCASLVDNLREELAQQRFERFLLSVVEVVAANPGINIETCRADAFVGRAFELALGLLREVSDPEGADDEDDDGAPRVVMP